MSGSQPTTYHAAPYAIIGRRRCGCVVVVGLIETREDRVRLERTWARDDLAVVPTDLDLARVSVSG